MSQQPIHIFVDEVNQRLVYALNLLLKDKGIDYQLENDPVRFEAADAPKFVYSGRPFKHDYFTLPPADLLFESGAHPVRTDKVTWQDIEIIAFKNIPDIIASAFYVAAMYHEHLPGKTDEHERVVGKNGFLDKNNWLQQCIVDRWSEKLIDVLTRELSLDLHRVKPSFQIIPTFDIDNAYAYKLKKGVRKYLSILKDVTKFNTLRLKERKQVLTGEVKDPYDTYDYIKNIAERGFQVKLFWLLGDLSDFDRNINWQNLYQQRLIQQMNRVTPVGLHPSYKSNEVLGALGDEKKRLEKILGSEVKESRQHFLKIEHRKTFSSLLGAGFTDDYSVGFADVVGFRAGLSRPFPWFNLKTNRISELTLHPFAYMEGTLKDYMHLSIDESKQVVETLLNEVEHCGGEFICLWHNETIGDYGKWKGWNEVLEFTLHYKTTEK